MKVQDYWKEWKQFLEKKFFECNFTKAEREAFFISFDRQNIDKCHEDIAVTVLKGSDEITALRAYKKRMSGVYKKFSILHDRKDKFKELRDLLEQEYFEWLKDKDSDLQLKDIIDTNESETASFYVERPPIESECCTAIEKPGVLIRIKAPQQMGKTFLIERILAHAGKQNYQTAILSCETDSTVFTDIEKFSRWFCASVGKRLGLPNKLTDYWDDIFGCNDNITAYFEEYLLAELTSPLVLALDRVDRVFEHPAIANDFCALLRGWNDKAKQSDKSGAIWKQLRLIVVHSTEVYGSLDINRSPLANVGKIFPLPEFTSKQVQDLARRHGLDWVGIQEVEQLMAMVGGHPYLIQQAFDYLERQNVTLEKFLQIAPTEESPFSDHLRKHLGHLQQNPDLATAFSEVVTKNQPVIIETAHAFKLQSMGLVQLQGNDCNPRCDLYRQYFSVRLAAT